MVRNIQQGMKNAGNCPRNILDSIKSQKIAHHVIPPLPIPPPHGSRNYLANWCQAWKCYSGHLEQLTLGGLIGQLRLSPYQKAQTSLDIFRDIFPLEVTQTGHRCTFAQVRRVCFEIINLCT